MNKIKRTLIITFCMMCLVILVPILVYGLAKGDRVSVTYYNSYYLYNYLSTANGFQSNTSGIDEVYCVQYGNSGASGSFPITHHIHIEGNDAWVDDVYVGNNKEFGKAAYVVNKDIDIDYNVYPAFWGYESNRGYSAYRRDLYFNTRCGVLMEALGIKDFATNPGYNPTEYDDLSTEYASNLTSNPLSITEDATARNTCESKGMISYNNNNYIYIGPFKWNYSGKLSDVKVYSNGNQVNNVLYATLSTSNGNITISKADADASKVVTSGNNFYVLVNTNEDITQITRIEGKLSGNASVYHADLWTIYVEGNYQNLLGVTKGVNEPSQINFGFDYEINLLGRLEVTKRGKIGNINTTIPDYKFKLYYMEGTTKKYLKLEGTRSNDNTTYTLTSVQSVTSANDATQIEISTNSNPNGSGATITIYNLPVRDNYYIEEMPLTKYKTDTAKVWITYTTAWPKDPTSMSGDAIGSFNINAGGLTRVWIDNDVKVGKLEIEKRGVYAGNKTTISGYKVKIYRMDGTTKKYIKVKGDRSNDDQYFVITEYDETTDESKASKIELTTKSHTYNGKSYEGVVFIYNIPIGEKYYIEEVEMKDYDTAKADVWITYGSNAWPDNPTKMNGKEIGDFNINEGQWTKVWIENQRKTGNLNIVKVDKDDNTIKMSGMEFKIRVYMRTDTEGNKIYEYIQVNGKTGTDNKLTGHQRVTSITTTSEADNATIFVTDGEGEIRLANLPVQKYYITETSVGNNYGYSKAKANIYWSIDGGTTKTCAATTTINIQLTQQELDDTTSADTKKYDEVLIYNEKQTGTLSIMKYDYETRNEADSKRIKLQNVEFKIKKFIKTDDEGKDIYKYIKVNGSETINKLTVVESVEYKSKAADGTTFKTISSGEIKLANIPVGKYIIEEIGNPNFGYVVDKNYIYWKYWTGEETNDEPTKLGTDGVLSLEVTRQKVQYTSVTNSRAVSRILVYNEKRTGNLNLVKMDKDNTSIKMSGVEFKMKVYTGKNEEGENIYEYIQVNEQTGTDNKLTGRQLVTSLATTKESNDATIFVTNNNGEIRLANLPVRTYYIYETSVGSNYGYSSAKANVSWTTAAQTDEITASEKTMRVKVVKQQLSDTNSKDTTKYDEILVYNKKQAGTLDIIKADYDKQSKKLENVEFKIKNSSGKYIIAKTGSNSASQTTVTGKVVLTGMGTTNTKANGTTFKTDSNGEIKLVNIPAGTYTIEETSVGATNEANGYELDTDYIYWKVTGTDGDPAKLGTGSMQIEVNVQASTATTGTSTTAYDQIQVYNQRKYVKVSGYVWNDKPGGKTNSFNHVYQGANENGKDTKIAGVIVRLKDKNNNIVKYKNQDVTATTDNNGAYMLQKVLLNDIANYYLEFEYDGEVYTTVKSFKELEQGAGTANTSKAQEVEAERTSLDNMYSEVTGKEKLAQSRNTADTEAYGYVGDKKINLKYDLTKANGGDAIATYNATKSDSYSKNKITANTKETDYGVLGDTTVNAIRKNDVLEIQDRNCGLRERDKIDLSVSKDLENVIVKVNGYTNTYTYAARNKFSNKTNENGEIEQYSDDLFRLTVKAKKINSAYSRELYASDIIEGGENDTTQVYMTYRTTIINHSTKLSAKVTSMSEYYDSRYTIVKSGTTKEMTGGITISDKNKWGQNGGNSDYKAAYITGLGTIESGGQVEYYIQYKLSKEAVVSILSGSYTLYNIAEIDGYTSYYGNNTYYHTGDGSRAGKVYASIDRNSAPGDIKLGDKNTFESYRNTDEDDTAAAPALTMNLREGSRTINGIVYEDDRTAESSANNERLGNGIYDTGEGKVQGVKVAVLKFEEGKTAEELEVAKVYSYSDGRKITKDAEVTTTASGEYTLEGLIPGNYILRFTYQNGNKIYKATGTTEIDANLYKATIITSDIIKNALNNNSISGDNSTKGKTITDKGKTYTNKKWYIINEGKRYSDAMDRSDIVTDSFNKTNKINNSNYNTIAPVIKEAFSGVMNVQIEYPIIETGDVKETTKELTVVLNSDGTVKVVEPLINVTENVDFGIIEKAKKDIELEKEITHVSIYWTNGQVILDGDPRETGENALQYVTYPPQESEKPRSRMLTIQMEDQFIYGSTLEIEYTVTAINKSEKNFLTDDYYRYGTNKTNEETIKLSKIIDYLDNELVLKEVTKGNVELLKTQNSDGTTKVVTVARDGEEPEIVDTINLKQYLDNSFEDIVISDFLNKLMLTSTSDLKSGDTDQWVYIANKVLATADELNFDGPVEVIEYETTETKPTSIPGNYDPSLAPEDRRDENDDYNVDLALTDPYGADKSLTYLVIGAMALVVLASGIIIIKKQVLK